MTAEKQFEANKKNALMSIDVLTDKGKAVVAKNAVNHPCVFRRMKTSILFAVCLIFVQLVLFVRTNAVADTAVYDEVKPLFITSDGDLLLLSLPDHQGFELIATKTGQRGNVTQTPNTEYFVTISPDKKYICYKEFSLINKHLLQVPVLYDINQKKVLQLCEAAPQVGSPIVSTQGKIAYTIGRKLVLLHSDLSKFSEIDLGDTVNLLSFSPDGNRVVFNNAKEIISWIDLETGIKTDVPASTLQGYHPRFSPNGQSLLTYSINGEVEACQLSSCVTSRFGKAESGNWVNDDQLAIVNKETRDDQVVSTSVLLGSLADNSIETLWTVQRNAEVVINAGAIAVVSGTIIQLGDIKTALWETLSLQPQTRSSVSARPLAQTVSPQSVIDNGTTVQLSGVPYIHQLYDTADNFVGGGIRAAMPHLPLWPFSITENCPPIPLYAHGVERIRQTMATTSQTFTVTMAIPTIFPPLLSGEVLSLAIMVALDIFYRTLLATESREPIVSVNTSLIMALPHRLTGVSLAKQV